MEVKAKKPLSTNSRKKSQFKPIRDYYHSHSFLKIKDNEWENGVDSDDEENGEWVREIETSVSIVVLISLQPEGLPELLALRPTPFAQRLTKCVRTTLPLQRTP